MVAWKDYIKASTELSPSALSLYMYLAKNQDDYNFYFSSKDYCQTFKVVDRTFRNAKSELLAKGYLREGENNHVYFDAKGGYKDTREFIRDEIKRLCKKISEKSDKYDDDIREELTKVKLKEINDDSLYIIKGKEIIAFLQEILNNINEADFSNLV